MIKVYYTVFKATSDRRMRPIRMLHSSAPISKLNSMQKETTSTMDAATRRKVQYKKPNDGLDRRALRAHRRSIEWKSFREDARNERRRILSDELSPVKEAPSRQPTPPRQIPIDPMRVKLEKWQAKRELKRQIEKRTNPKKPVFKCTALKPEEYDVKKLKVVKAPPVHTAPTSVPKTRTTRANNKAAPTTSNKPAPKNRLQTQPPARTTRVTASKAPVNEPTTKQQTRTTKTRKPAPEPVPTGRVTRSRSAAVVTAPPPKPEPKSKRPSRKPVTDVPKKPIKEVSQTKQQKASSHRVPIVLNPVVPAEFNFRPLSPQSVKKYFNPSPEAPVNEGGRCSTPKSTITYRFRETPALSTITPTSAQNLVASDSMDRESPIMKLANAVKHSPLVKHSPAVRRSTRRSVLSLPIVTDALAEETAEELREETETKKGPAEKSAGDTDDSVFEPTVTTATITEVDPIPEVTNLGIENTQVAEVEKKNCTAESAPAELETEQMPFRTPRTATKAQRRRTTSAILALGNSAHRTPKALRQSFILRHLSPEEGVEVLKMSPMIEMDRRKRKSSGSPYRPNPLPSFDDIDDIIPPEPEQEKKNDVVMKEDSVAKTNDDVTESVTEVPMETDAGIPVTQPSVEVAQPSVSDAPASADTPAVQPEPSVSAAQAEPAVSAAQKHDVPYFRGLLVSEADRLNALCATWEDVLSSSQLTEEDQGEIRTSIGKAQLLIAQRFKQFRGLVDNCEFNTGEQPVREEDLDGFWDMVYFQVEDIDRMFNTLVKLQANGWQREKPKAKKKVLKKKPATAKPAVKGRSNFRMFMAIKKKMEEEKPAAASVDENVSTSVEQSKDQATSEEPATNVSNPAEGTTEMRPSTSEATTEEAVPTISEAAILDNGPSPAPAKAGPPEPAQETKQTEQGVTNLEIPVVIPAMGEALETGIFMTRSPAKTPREYSKGNTPRRRSGRSMGVTPGAVTPLMRTLLERNARRSTGANSIPKKATRKSETGMQEPQRRLSSSEHSVRSKCVINSTTPSASGQTESSAVEVEEAAAPQIVSLPATLVNAPSLFTPDTCSQRSSRRSEANQSLMETSIGCEENDDPFLKYLQPTSQGNTEEEPRQMEQGSPPIEDVDMAGTMKRDLISEFNAHATSAKKRHSLGPSYRRTPTRQSLPSEEKLSSSATRRSRRRSGAASNRRSVQFNFVALPEDEAEATNKVPGTPANRRRLDDQKENQTPISSNKSAVIDTETPATKLARLCVAGDETSSSPARLKRRAFPSLLYTPTQEVTDVSFVEPVDNLMSFSPLPENSTSSLIDFGNKTPVSHTPHRRSSRLSLL